MDGHDPKHPSPKKEDTKQSTDDLTTYVQNVLQRLKSNYQIVTNSMDSRIDQMSSRIEEMEKSINEARAEMGVDETETEPSTSVPKTEEKAPSSEEKPKD